MRLRILIGPGVLLLFWSLLTGFGLVRPLFLPAPWDVVLAFGRSAADGLLFSDLLATLFRTASAFVAGAFLGLIIGIPLGTWRALYDSCEVVFDFFRSMPSPALIPLAMLLFGLGDLSRIAVAAFTCTLINAIQAAYAIRSIPRYRILAAKLGGAKGLFLVRHVFVPSILPGLVAGWRITLSLALIIVVVTEMFIGTQSGLGLRIYELHLMFRIADMYAFILAVGLLGYTLNKIVATAEGRWVHWGGV